MTDNIVASAKCYVLEKLTGESSASAKCNSSDEETGESVAIATSDAHEGVTSESVASAKRDTNDEMTEENFASTTHDAHDGKTWESVARATRDAKKEVTGDSIVSAKGDATDGVSGERVANVKRDVLDGVTGKSVASAKCDADDGVTQESVATAKHDEVTGEIIASAKCDANDVTTGGNVAGAKYDASHAVTWESVASATPVTNDEVTWETVASAEYHGATWGSISCEKRDSNDGMTGEGVTSRKSDANDGVTGESVASPKQDVDDKVTGEVVASATCDPEPSHDDDKISDASRATRTFTVDEQHTYIKPETENKVSQNCKKTKQFQSCLAQDNRKCKLENCDLLTEIKGAIRNNRTSKKVEGDRGRQDTRLKSAVTGVTNTDNTRDNDMMKGDGWDEERLIIHFPAKIQQAVFEKEQGLQSYPEQPFHNLQKLGDKFERIAASLSGKDTDFFDNVYSKETSIQLLRRARNEALLPAGTFDVQTVAPSTLYDPIAFFSSPLERLRWEFWRLCTFAPLSDSLPVSPIRLAQSGFSFDEEQDDIICFSCGLRKRHWSEKEKAVAVVHLALNGNCPHANFADDTNVPIETDTPRLSSTPGTGQPQSEVFHRERRDDSIRTDYEVPDGLQSSEGSEYHFNGVITANHTPTPANQRSSQNGHTAAISGGNEQNGQVQAYSLPPPISRAEELAALSAGTALQQTVVSSCPNASDTQRTQSQALSTTNVPAATAAGHSQYPVQPEQAPEAVPPETLRYGSQGNSEDHSALESDGDHSETSGLDMRRAACPGNSSVKGRLATFGDWPGAGLPTPRDLVPAGFYYMGKGDSVRCFYCGVTLRNWREHDDPWLTHVRFRFSCAYVTAIKGENFVLQALVKHANEQPVTGEAEQTER